MPALLYALIAAVFECETPSESVSIPNSFAREIKRFTSSVANPLPRSDSRVATEEIMCAPEDHLTRAPIALTSPAWFRTQPH